MIVPGFFLAYAGLTALCLAMDRHHRQVRQFAPTRTVATGFRLAGWTLLGISLIVSMTGAGWSLGLVAWCGVLTAAAFVLVLVMTYRNRIAMPAAVIALLSSLIAISL